MANHANLALLLDDEGRVRKKGEKKQVLID